MVNLKKMVFNAAPSSDGIRVEMTTTSNQTVMRKALITLISGEKINTELISVCKPKDFAMRCTLMKDSWATLITCVCL